MPDDEVKPPNIGDTVQTPNGQGTVIDHSQADDPFYTVKLDTPDSTPMAYYDDEVKPAPKGNTDE